MSPIFLPKCAWTLGIALFFTGCLESPEKASAHDAETSLEFNRIKWVTARETNNMGFNIYRGEHEDGPFMKINEKPILGAGTSSESRTYSYIDNTIDPTRTYYYFVENITFAGHQKRFTPILRAPPKRKPAAGSGMPTAGLE